MAGTTRLELATSASHQAIPQHGGVPAEPASVSPGKIICSSTTCIRLNFRFRRDPGGMAKVLSHQQPQMSNCVGASRLYLLSRSRIGHDV